MVMNTVRVSAVLPPDLLLNAAYESGVPGNIGKAGIGRYALARLAGHDHAYAMSIARPAPSGGSLKTGNTPTAFDVPEEILTAAKNALPPEVAKNQSQVIRYSLAVLNGYSEEDALKLATYKLGRPRKNNNGGNR